MNHDMNEKKNKIGWAKTFIFGSGDVALNICYTVFASFVLLFYTDYVFIAPAVAGGVIFASRIFDGISDVIAGDIIDHTHTKSGRCIPWLERVAIPYAVSFVLVFTMPRSNAVVMGVYLFVTYNLFNTIFFTMANLAHITLPIFVTDDQDTRSLMITMKMFFAAGCQIIIANVTLPAIQALGGDQAAWIKLSAIFAVVSVIFMTFVSSVIKEKECTEESAEKSKENDVSLFQAIKYGFQNKYWLIALGICMTATLQLVFITTISTYYMRVVLGDANLIGKFILASNLPALAVYLLMGKFFRYFNKQQICIAATVIQIIGGLIFAFGPVTSMPILYISAVLKGGGFSAVYALASGMIIDSVEYGEWKTGVRVQGVLTSASGVAQKLGNGLGTAVFSAVLSCLAYDGSKEVQTQAVISGVTAVFKWVPLVVLVLQLILLFAYKLDKIYPDIIKDLENRRMRNTK